MSWPSTGNTAQRDEVGEETAAIGQKSTTAITGVTGKPGGTVATGLQDLVPQLRLLVCGAGRVPWSEGDVAVMECGDAEASRKALTGVDVFSMVSIGESPSRVHQHQVFVEAVTIAGVRHIVYTSFLATVPDAIFILAHDHWYTKQHIRESGVVWIFLHDSFYLDFFPGVVDEHGMVHGPAGNGRVGVVARQDVTRPAVAVLHDLSPHAERIYDITGLEAPSLTDMARIIGEAQGREATYREETVEEAYASCAHHGVPTWQVDAWVSAYTAIASGELDVVSDSVRVLTGRSAMSMADLLGQDWPDWAQLPWSGTGGCETVGLCRAH